MSEQLGLGHLIPDDVIQHRDAIHIAVMPVVANAMLRPGQRVHLTGFVANDLPIAAAWTIDTNYIGIIDPFLKVPVLRGQKCWLWLEPGSITSLRHEWTHPFVDKE